MHLNIRSADLAVISFGLHGATSRLAASLMALTLDFFSHNVAICCSLGREPEEWFGFGYLVLKGR